ncbi:hypothetical protein [Adlercreutzia caecimuris]|uniref:hypothetical protein n=1 Tax=Adlercreutzia caecimuris TaxID=671266 RepID=UPI0025848425|nr:hypothetical protein [Adlercreutzia caecimuris]
MERLNGEESKIYQDAFVLVLSEYIDVIPSILSRMDGASFAKLLMVAFLVRRSRLMGVELYSGRDKNNLLPKALIQAGASIDDLAGEVPMFSAAVDLLIGSGKALVDGDAIKIGGNCELNEPGTPFSAFIASFIEECSSLSDEYILEEVLRSV